MCFFLILGNKTSTFWGQPRGPVVKFTRSALAIQGFAGLDPRHRHGTTHQVMLSLCITQHNQGDLQLEYTTVFWGPLGRRKRKRLATDVSSGPIFKKRKKKQIKKYKVLLSYHLFEVNRITYSNRPTGSKHNKRQGLEYQLWGDPERVAADEELTCKRTPHFHLQRTPSVYFGASVSWLR